MRRVRDTSGFAGADGDVGIENDDDEDERKLKVSACDLSMLQAPIFPNTMVFLSNNKVLSVSFRLR